MTIPIRLNVVLAMLLLSAAVFMLNPAAAENNTASEKKFDWSNEVVESESGIYYTVKKGDTLWDLSQKFSDSPYLWPDLWSDNDQIANPHLIYPGQRIMLYRRSDIEQHEKQVEAAAPVEAEPEEIEQPVLEPEVEAPPQPASGYSFSTMDEVGFIRKNPVKPHGAIFKVRDDRKMISYDNIVYASHGGPQTRLSPGQRYTIYRLIGPIKDPVTKLPIGMQHYLLGILEVIQSEPDFAVARVLRSFIDIKVGDLLMPYEPRSPDIPNRTSVPGMQGEIIKAMEGNKLIGPNMLAFINRGEKDGVAPGQRYSIFSQASDSIHPESRAEKQLNRVVFGEFLVVHTEETTSTVYITQTDINVKQGASFCTPF